MEKENNRRKRKEIQVEVPTIEEDSDNSCHFNSDTGTLEHPPLKRRNVCIENPGCSSTFDANSSGSDAESEEWEDVEDGSLGESFYKPEAAGAICHNQDNLHGKVVAISIDLPGTSHGNGRKSTENCDWSKQIQFHVNRFNRALQLHLHKVHLICLIASALHNNKTCNDAELQARALSQVPIHLVLGASSAGSCTFDLSWFSVFIKWFRASYCVGKTASRKPAKSVDEVLHQCIEEMSVSKESDKALICLTTTRALGLQARLIKSLQPIPVKYNMLRKVLSKEVPQKEYSPKGKPFDADFTPKRNVKKKQKVSKTNLNSSKPKRNSGAHLGMNKVLRKYGNKKKMGETSPGSDCEADVLLKTEVQVLSKTSSACRKTSNRHILSSDSEDDCRKDVVPSNRTELNSWIEIYLPQEKKWICVDCVGGHIDRPDLCEQSATNPICYIIAVDNENCVKDVTKRYASKWMHETEKLRAPLVWWENTLKPYHTKLIKKDKEEDEHLQKQLQEKPMPTSISEFKNHHLYVLKRHLLKFEALYPESATILGYCRGEAVYSRNCVHTLHTKETWKKQGLAIQHGEKPYKMVKARPRKNKSHEPLLPLYGQWQTELYIPPAAVDGKVPRNEYGNVELFQPSMLPMGTVHLQIPGLHRVAQKIGVDCAPAMVGWDYHGGFCHPVFDGFVVCKEFTDILLDNWEKDNAEREHKLNQKKRIRAEKNWKTLVTGLLIRERLNDRFQRTLSPTAGSEDDIDSWPLNKLNQLKDEEK
ncbi:DNA repair protein complementing XP-C cells homolog [Patiria miniata]|uniref:Uncharacterized protein n=1 Tax=Patiria miniata TaxID=46514 RepID=A0A914BAP0_PATMI|nr:DNA repair protein complementing XP-C cells homolog [Patiria miniata]XP_038073079.1 DNA repair protein complementing XP-C cells homolog [Patiria miniata]